jgi:acetyl esterase
MEQDLPPLDPEHAAVAAMLRERGLVALSPMTAPVAEARAALDRIAAFLGEGSVPIPGERDITVPGGPRCRFYPAAPGAPVLVYAHGGSFALGSLDAWDAMLRDLVRRSGIAALHVDYRMIPEHRFPAAPEDMLAAVRWVAAEGASLGIDPARMALGGDSAGANLALGAAMALRDAGGKVQPRLLLLHYGVYSTDHESPSWQRLGGGEWGLSRATIAWLWDNYLADPAQKGDWRAAPLAGEMRGLPPAVLTIGTHDPLLDDQYALAAALGKADVNVRLLIYSGLTHGFIRQGRLVAKVRQAMEDSAAALREVLFA